MAWAVAINSTSNEEFPYKILKDELKSLCCIYYMNWILNLPRFW